MRPRDDRESAAEGGATIKTPFCPSAPSDSAGSVVFGVVLGTLEEPEVAYLDRMVPVTEEVIALAAPARPTEVFRFAAPCAEDGCQHFKASKCQLVQRLLEVLPDVADRLPPCHLRQSCRWFLQEGKETCMMCPQVTTDVHHASQAMRYATGLEDHLEDGQRAPERRVVHLRVVA